MYFQSLPLILLVFLGANLSASAELREFQNTDQSKSFFAELTHYDIANKRVSVRLKNGRKQHFSIDILSEDDQKYVIENGKRLAVGNDIRMTLQPFSKKYQKSLEPRIVNRIYPRGYTISLSNRAQRAYTNLTLNYTLYYAVQGYIKPEREQKEISGTHICKKITSQEKITLKTKTVDIITGKLDPIIKNVSKKNAAGVHYTVPVVEQPGGRRKDLLLGCKVDILVDGAVVKSITDGTINIKESKKTP